MKKKNILLAYASRYGSTKEIAEEVGEILRDRGLTVDVKNVMTVTDLSGYDAVVIGSPIHMGKWIVEAVDFIKINQNELRKVPVAVFSVGFSVRHPHEENLRKAKASIAAIRPYIHPLDVGIFGGKIDFDLLVEPDRQILLLAGAEDGDFRDWDEITAWASGLEALLVPPVAP
jgi:menaquinone-dependent protoporphyrinogen oxidase